MKRKRNRAKGDGEISTIATGQSGVISVDQLRVSGLSAQAASQRASRARLHRVHRGVYSVGHEAIGSGGRLLAAVLACGPGSAISHLSAAALWGVRVPAPVVIDVIVPCETGRKIDGIRARRCRYPTVDEVTRHEGIPCTTPSRTLIDLAGTLGRHSLRRAVEQAVVLRLLDIAALDIAMTQAKGRRGIPALRSIVAPWRVWGEDLPRLRSILEARLLPALAELGIPRPRCNAKLRLAGELVEVDLLWEGKRLAIETDGEETHGTRAAFQHDRWRDQVLTAAGYRVARVTWRQAVDEPEAVATRIGRMLEH
jgi:REase_MTES_1575/AbiEi antitoxin C-terminal domain